MPFKEFLFEITEIVLEISTLLFRQTTFKYDHTRHTYHSIEENKTFLLNGKSNIWTTFEINQEVNV